MRLRVELYDQQSGKCWYCGGDVWFEESHLEHQQPKSRNGKNDMENLVLACARCNLSKGSMNLEEYREYCFWNQLYPITWYQIRELKRLIRKDGWMSTRKPDPITFWGESATATTATEPVA